MKLKGLGVDIFERKRMQAALKRKSAVGFLRRVFRKEEIAGVKNTIIYSVHFAVKEAVLKALGMGWNAYANFLDIKVTLKGNAVSVVLSGKTKDLAKKLGVKKIVCDHTVSPRHVVAVAALIG